MGKGFQEPGIPRAVPQRAFRPRPTQEAGSARTLLMFDAESRSPDDSELTACLPLAITSQPSSSSSP